jgi:hypothetical protein
MVKTPELYNFKDDFMECKFYLNNILFKDLVGWGGGAGHLYPGRKQRTEADKERVTRGLCSFCPGGFRVFHETGSDSSAERGGRSREEQMCKRVV